MSPVNFDIYSEAACRRIYLDYYCYGNTMQTDSKTIGQITNMYSDRLSDWQNNVSSDVDSYDFVDDPNNYAQQGWDEAHSDVGANKTDGWGRTAADVGMAGVSVASHWLPDVTNKVIVNGLEKKAAEATADAAAKKVAAASTKEAAELGKNALDPTIGKTLDGVAEVTQSSADIAADAATKAEAKVTEQQSKNLGWVLGCIMGAATAAAYTFAEPNKDGKAAVETIYNEVLPQTQSELEENQQQMADATAEVSALSDEAVNVTDTANASIEETHTESRMYSDTLKALSEKENLTEDEIALFEELKGLVEENQESISATSDATKSDIGAINSNIGTYQGVYDNSAANIQTAVGSIDYAIEIGKSVRTQSYVEAGAQALNAGSTQVAAAKGFKFATALSTNPFSSIAAAAAWATVLLGETGAIGSGYAAYKEVQYANGASQEIDLAEMTADLALDTADIYTQDLDFYQTTLDNIPNLNLNIPEDNLEAPELTDEQTTSEVNEEENDENTGLSW